MSQQTIDLRSDTVTRPCPGMRRAMADAVVGDDLYQDDQTVKALEEEVAAMLGKEAAVFMPTGTMSNQVALRCLTRPGDEAVIHATYHIHFYESAQTSDLAKITLNGVDPIGGILTAVDVENALARKPRGPDYAAPRLVCVENTVNAVGGRVYPIGDLRVLRQFTQHKGMYVHMDGARLWNAAVASGVSLAEYGRQVDTVSVCFAKGLGAPAGSALAGSRELLRDARRFRKWYGGSMHQVGILAAAARYALDHNLKRLSEDHDNARLLASRLVESLSLPINPALVESNIILVDVSGLTASASYLTDLAREEGVLAVAWPPNAIRMVTHLDISKEDVEEAARRLTRVWARFCNVRKVTLVETVAVPS